MSVVEIGDVLDGRYRIDRPIARGGMSTVYRCVDLRLGRAVAAKVMHDNLANDPSFVQRFTREARAMAQLSHPNLLSIHDFSATSRPIFLVMELITGGTVRELVAERGAMPVHCATAIMRAVLSGLSFIHAHGLVHRDIKPDNVLIDADHRIKLGDFGLIRQSSQAQTTGQIVGTVSYLSPEQVTGEKITPASDVYSAGILLFELLTTRTPFSGNTPLEHARDRLSRDVPAPSSLVEGVPALFDALVAEATTRNPRQRFADAAEFLAALDDVAAELSLPAFTVPIPHNSAAGRTAAQPTDFTGVRQDSVFAPTSHIDPEAPTEITEEPRPRLDFDTRTETPYPAAPPYAAPDLPAPDLPAPEFPGAPGARAYPPLAPVRRGPAELEEDDEDEAEPDYQPVLSNRSPVVLILWLVILTVVTCATALGGWWFGSDGYGDFPQLWH